MITVGPSLNAYNDIQNLFSAPPRSPDTVAHPAECLLVVDSGFSHTTVTPLFNGRPIPQAIRRLDIGGKFLTNYLKELISIRQYHMLNETYVMNEIKETVCYVTNDFKHDLDIVGKGVMGTRKIATSEATKKLAVEYVLPEYTLHKAGFMRSYDPINHKRDIMAGAGKIVEEAMTIGNERFAVPEILFSPRDVGIMQAGLPEMVLQSMSGLPQGLWPAMLANILVVGGNSNMDGFMTRLYVSHQNP